MQLLKCNNASPDANLIFIHGGPGMDHTCFSPFVDGLTSRFNLVLHTCGHSGILDMQGLVSELDDVISGLDSSQKIYLVAHSFGACVGVEYMKSGMYKGRINGQVLVGWIHDPSWMSLFMENNKDYKEPSIPEDLSGDARFKFMVNAEWNLYFSEQNRSLAEQVLSGMTYNSALMENIFCTYHKDFDLTPILKGLEIPVCSIIASGDAVVDKSHIRDGESHIKNLRSEVIEDAGHFMFCEQPQKFCDIVASFVEESND